MNGLPERIGRFDILEEVGKGATATVYRAVSADYPNGVAIKHVRFTEGEARRVRRLRKLLKAEAAVARRLDHPNIIRVLEVEIGTDDAYVVMEYFAGEPLSRHCGFDRLLPLHRVMSIVFKCCMALDHAFHQGIVHRDIKPDNILVDEDDNVKIIDFGLALNLKKKLDTDSTFILGVGSPSYMSPEQIKNYPLNQKTDLYSLGVVLFHLLTGRLPFRAANPAQLVYRILNVDPPLASRLNPDLPESVDRVIFKALQKDLYSRYRNGAEFAQELSGIRYKIVDENQRPSDTQRFSALRRVTLLAELDDVELWELLRISAWRIVPARSSLFREGDEDERFGLVIDGSVDLSIAGRSVARVAAGEMFGELAWLDAQSARQMAAAVTASDTIYLEISPAAVALASEELRDKVRAIAGAVAARRCAAALRAVSLSGEPAVVPQRAAPGRLDLQLVGD